MNKGKIHMPLQVLVWTYVFLSLGYMLAHW